MLVLFTYVIWSILYLIVSFLFSIFLKFSFFKNIFKKDSIIIKKLLLIFFNENLSFYKNELSEVEKQNIEYLRYSKYSLLNLIHNKINLMFLKKQKNNLNFKNKYNIYKYLINNKFNFNIDNINSVIIYSIIKNIISCNINNIYCADNQLLYYNIFKNSISDKQYKVKIINFKKLNINLNTNNNLYLKKNKLNSYKNKIINVVNYINKIKNINTNLININSFFLNKITNLYNINFSASNIVKYISDLTINKTSILFLRKNKVFNKSRYSRNRQTYRTGAYWCLYINIIAVIAFYFWFYNFTMNFGYTWWLLYAFILSFVFFKAIKFNFYNLKTLNNEFRLSINWYYCIVIQIIKFLLSYVTTLYNVQKIELLVSSYLNSNKILQYYKNSLIKLYKFNDLILNKINL